MSQTAGDWDEVPLGELVSRITKGTTPKTYGFSYCDEGVRFVKAESLSRLRIVHSLCSFVSEDAHNAFRRSQLEPNDVLFTIAGTLGRAAVVSDRDIPANTNQAVAIIKLKMPETARFIAHFLSSVNPIAWGGRGTGLQNLNLEQVAAIRIPLPPLVEQSRIISKLDKLIDHSKNALDELKLIPRLVHRYKEAVLAEVMEANEAGEMWPRVALEKLLTEGPTNGYSPRSGENANGTLSLKLTATTRGVMDLSERAVKRLNEVIPNNSKFWLQRGDILIQRANSLEYVGMTAIYDGPPRTYIYPDLMIRIRVSSPTLARWIWRYCSSTAARKYFTDNATGTAGNMPKINGAIIRRLQIPLPPANQMETLLGRLDRALHEIEALRGEAERAERLLDRLDQSTLAKAFRGELMAGTETETVIQR